MPSTGPKGVEYCWPPSAYSIHQESSCYPSRRLQHCQGTFNKATIRLDIAYLPLTIPSTRNHPFHFYSAKTMLVIVGLFFTVPSIRNPFSHNAASTGQGSVGCCGHPLYIPSNRNHLCLLHEALSWARIMFGVNDAHLTNSSTRSNHHLLYAVFNRFMITLGVVGLLLTIPSTRNLFFPSMACSTGSAGGFSFPYHPLSLVLELETHLFSLSLAHGQKP